VDEQDHGEQAVKSPGRKASPFAPAGPFAQSRKERAVVDLVKSPVEASPVTKIETYGSPICRTLDITAAENHFGEPFIDMTED
jgi:hypothetical protein